MNVVRWGLLSTANINQAIIPAIRSSSRGELVAVASRSLENAQQYAKKWKIKKAFGSYEELLSSGEVEDLQAAILDGLPTLISLEETRNHILTVLVLYKSAKISQLVKLQDFIQE